MPDYACDYDPEDVILLRLGALLEQPPTPTVVSEVESPDCPRCGALMAAEDATDCGWALWKCGPCGYLATFLSEVRP